MLLNSSKGSQLESMRDTFENKSAKLLEELLTEKSQNPTRFPKVGFLLLCNGSPVKCFKNLKNLPETLITLIEEFFIFYHFTDEDSKALSEELDQDAFWKQRINAYQAIKNLGPVGYEKLGFQYVIEKGFDQIVVIPWDKSICSANIIELLYQTIILKKKIVFSVVSQNSRLRKYLEQNLFARFTNIVLGLNLSSFQFTNRSFSVAALKKIPFEVNSENESFDLDLIIQSRMIGIPPTEIVEFSRADTPFVKSYLSLLFCILRYRFHQIGLIYDKRYLPKGSVLYTLKTSPFSSHEIILNLVKNNSEVLDVGCGTGLLSQCLDSKQVKATGIDYEVKENVWSGFDTYIQDDLERAEKLPRERKFDYILLADVLEHLRTPGDLLRKVRPLLKTDGKLIASTGNVALWYMRLSLLVGRFNYGKKGILDETHVKLYTKYSFVQLLSQTGFVPDKIIPTSLPFEVVFQSTGKSKVLKLIDQAYYLLARLWPKMFAYQFVVQASLGSLETHLGEGKIIK